MTDAEIDELVHEAPTSELLDLIAGEQRTEAMFRGHIGPLMIQNEDGSRQRLDDTSWGRACKKAREEIDLRIPRRRA